MTNRRAKIAAGATVVGLAALGGVALGSNPGVSSVTQAGSGATTASVVTGASGATTVPAAQTAALHRNAGAPIVTRASGTGGAPRDD